MAALTEPTSKQNRQILRDRQLHRIKGYLGLKVMTVVEMDSVDRFLPIEYIYFRKCTLKKQL